VWTWNQKSSGIMGKKVKAEKVFTFDLDLKTLDITNIQPRFRTDRTQFEMEGFHRGMPDLEYDKFVPDGFGK